MTDQLICPDCGGIIGATETTDAGRPCICFGATDKKASAVGHAERGKTAAAGKFVDPPEPASDWMAEIARNEDDPSSDTVKDAPAEKMKVCCSCGIDVNGKKRTRDSRGYWCYECHLKDKAANKVEGVRCADCGLKKKPSALFDYEGLKICQSCRQDRMDLSKNKRKFSGVDDSSYKNADRTRMMVMLFIVGVLIVIIILGNVFHLL